MLWSDDIEGIQVHLKLCDMTTYYRQYIEKDAALARRFQPVMVNEPTVEDTISILRGLKERYEGTHGVFIDRLTTQFITAFE
jgi:ATP-dependent Clp protease ATP-binding subunit ClpA